MRGARSAFETRGRDERSLNQLSGTTWFAMPVEAWGGGTSNGSDILALLVRHFEPALYSRERANDRVPGRAQFFPTAPNRFLEAELA